jgi:hypothetical protein
MGFKKGLKSLALLFHTTFRFVLTGVNWKEVSGCDRERLFANQYASGCFRLSRDNRIDSSQQRYILLL